MDKSSTIYHKRISAAGDMVYQQYYHMGMKAAPGTRFVEINNAKRLSNGFPINYFRHGRLLKEFSREDDRFVGEYILELPRRGVHVKFAIDAHDNQAIFSNEVFCWSDVYFKSNMWSIRSYPQKVLPIVNGNGVLRNDMIRMLSELRRAPKRYDVVFISRPWGGREHNIRLFEQLAKAKGNHVLRVLFTPEEKSKTQTQEYIKRLDRSGVPHSIGTIPARELWGTLSQARIVFVRAGKHLCIPWRMIDLLAMGSCIVMDSNPYPRWPVPLEEGRNYVSAQIDRPESGAPGEEDQYKRIPHIIDELLSDQPLQNRIRKENIRYFENHAAPEPVGQYVLSRVNAYIRS